ncbi:MAG: hypothetical protein MUC63_03840 [Planctomycetes bacterium]|jgi:hypothetical protein|nr:hypothetical protein [Planctomycetota bacterium]
MNRPGLALAIVLGVALSAAAARAGDEALPPASREAAAPPKDPAVSGGAPGPEAEGGDEREVPEPRLPGVETLPPGVSPEPWTTWATNQDVDRLTRIDLRLCFGAGTFLPLMAGSGTDAPKHDEFCNLEMGGFARIGVDLSPALGLALGLFFGARREESNRVVASASGGPSGAEVERAGPIAAGFLGLRFSLPFSHLGGRLFRFSRTEAPTGLTLSVLAGGGLSFLGSVDMVDDSAPDGWRRYWEDSNQPCFLVGLGLEYRWVNIGIFADFAVMNLGTPEPSTDPVWAASSVAEPMVAILASVGFSFHF